ncbi:MAG: DNA gyrase inhibitor YacG [Planctomycetia bacterium]
MPLCPVCDAAVRLEAAPSAPVCSERCRLIDLGRWLDEAYAVPEKPRDDEEDDGEGERIPPGLLDGDE